MDFIFTAPHTLDPIHFPMTRQEVRTALNQPYDTFQKSKSTSADIFTAIDLLAYYTNSDEFYAVELARGVSTVFYKQTDLFKLSYSQVKRLFRGNGYAVSGNSERIFIKELSLAFWYPLKKTICESILVGKPGLYDD